MKMEPYQFNGKVFKATRKDLAIRQILANTKRQWFMVGDKVKQFHFHSGWYLATHVDTIVEFADRHSLTPTEFADNIHVAYNAMNYHMDPEIGKRPLFYVEVI